MLKPTQPGKVIPQGVGTIAFSCASPVAATAAFAWSQHFRANEIMSFFFVRPAATLVSEDSSAVIAPFATPCAISRTTVPETCTISSAAVRIPGTGWL
jgi:hypothetical protein